VHHDHAWFGSWGIQHVSVCSATWLCWRFSTICLGLENIVALVVFVSCTTCSDVGSAHLRTGALVDYVCCTACTAAASYVGDPHPCTGGWERWIVGAVLSIWQLYSSCCIVLLFGMVMACVVITSVWRRGHLFGGGDFLVQPYTRMWLRLVKSQGRGIVLCSIGAVEGRSCAYMIGR